MPLKTQRVKNVPKLDLRHLSNSVGDFIRYWGFRRIHGQIWTQLYLSPTPLSGAHLVKNLKVSKALVSPALRELRKYGLIKLAGGDQKTKLYTAEEDVFSVIKQILESREHKLLQQTKIRLDEVNLQRDKLVDAGLLNPVRFHKLSDMTESALAALQMIVAQVEQK